MSVAKSAILTMAQETAATLQYAESTKLWVEVSEKPGEQLWTIFCSSCFTKLQQWILQRLLAELLLQWKRGLPALKVLLWPVYSWLCSGLQRTEFLAGYFNHGLRFCELACRMPKCSFIPLLLHCVSSPWGEHKIQLLKQEKIKQWNLLKDAISALPLFLNYI